MTQEVRSQTAEGDHLVLTFRSGYADEEGRPWHEVMPRRLAGAVGATYLEFTNLAAPVVVRAAGEGLEVTGGHALGWADALTLREATALAHYEHPHLGRWPAIVSNHNGAGRVSYVGTLPDPPLARSLAQWVASQSLSDEPCRALAPSVTVTSGLVPAGRLRFVHNWSWDPVTVPAPSVVEDVLSGDRLGKGSDLVLGPWDVRVLLEPAT